MEKKKPRLRQGLFEIHQGSLSLFRLLEEISTPHRIIITKIRQYATSLAATRSTGTVTVGLVAARERKMKNAKDFRFLGMFRD